MEIYVKFKVPIELLSALIQHSNTRSTRSLAYYRKQDKPVTPKRLANRAKWERLRFSHSKIAVKVEGEKDMFLVTLPRDAAEYMFDSYNKELKPLHSRLKRDFQRKYLSEFLVEEWRGPPSNEPFYDVSGINNWRSTAMPTIEPVLIPLPDITPLPQTFVTITPTLSESTE